MSTWAFARMLRFVTDRPHRPRAPVRTPLSLRSLNVQTTFQAALFLGLCATLAEPVPIAAQPSPARPGGVVLWPAEGLESCGLDERRWDPVDGACWYPVDLLATGPLELVRWRHGQRESRPVEVAAYPYDVQRLEIADDSRVNLSPENAARAARESARVARLWSGDREALFSLPLGPPLADLPDGGRFGSRRIINGQPRSPHTGADYSAGEGEPVLAVAAGVVALAEEHFFAGNSVFLDHGGGLVSMYFHLSRIDVEPGESVDRGQRIGAVGATGRATGPHLHFGLRWHGARIDPATLLGDPAELTRLE